MPTVKSGTWTRAAATATAIGTMIAIDLERGTGDEILAGVIAPGIESAKGDAAEAAVGIGSAGSEAAMRHQAAAMTTVFVAAAAAAPR